MKLTTRELATIAVFGTLWGISEITMGSVLHTLNIPFTGAFLAAIGLMIALVGRVFVPRKGSIFVHWLDRNAFKTIQPGRHRYWANVGNF